MIQRRAAQTSPILGTTSQDIADAIDRDHEKRYYGIYRGYVEDNLDPWRVGRVKVRVPVVHRGYTAVQLKDIEWAWRCSPWGGGFDLGGLTVLPVGVSVFVMFESGNPMKPVVVGAYYGIPSEPQVYGQFRETELPVPPEKRSDGPWKQRTAVIEQEDEAQTKTMGQSEVPLEARRLAFHVPTVNVPFKTAKGASLAIEDRDSKEWMALHDRFGQGLFFSSRSKKDKNSYNAMARGLSSVFSGTQYNYKADTDNRESSVSLRDAAQQAIHLEARQYDERVKVVSKEGQKGDGFEKDIDSGGDTHVVELGAGQRRTVIEVRRGGESFGKIMLDSQTGTMTFDALGPVRIKGSKITITGNRLEVQGDLVVNGDLHVAGDESVVGEVTHGTITRERARIGA